MTKPVKPMTTIRESIRYIQDTRYNKYNIERYPTDEEWDEKINRLSYHGNNRRLVDLKNIDDIKYYPLTPDRNGPSVQFGTLKGVQFELPPSANSMYYVKSGKLVKTKEYSDWMNKMHPILGAEFHKHRVDWAQSVGVLIFANLRRKSDLDNIQKGILDCLVKAEIFPDDNFVDFIYTVRSKLPDEGFFMLDVSYPFENDKYWHE